MVPAPITASTPVLEAIPGVEPDVTIPEPILSVCTPGFTVGEKVFEYRSPMKFPIPAKALVKGLGSLTLLSILHSSSA